MCYMCLRENPFDVMDAFGRKHGKTKLDEIKARALIVKELLKVVDEEAEPKCDIGDATVERLREEQHKISRQL